MPDVLIFDDDPGVSELVSEVLHARGLSAAHFPSGAGVVQIVKDARPRLVVLDIMMPGVDGLTACRSIRESPATRHVKIVVLTAKNFEADRDAAKRYGADLFVNKPFDTVAFSAGIGKLLNMAEPAAAAPIVPAAPLIISLLRGGAVIEAPGLWIFLDAGAGIARWLAEKTPLPPVAWVLLSRYDDEALVDFRAFAHLLKAGVRVNLAGPDDADSLLQRLAPRMAGLPGERSACMPLLYPQREGELQLAPGFMAATRYTQHAGSCIAWRVDAQGRRVVWAPANEVPPVAAAWNHHEREKFRALFADADLLLHGFGCGIAQEPSPQARYRGTWEPVVALARESRVKRLSMIPMGDACGEGIEDLVARAGTAGGTECRVVPPDVGWIL